MKTDNNKTEMIKATGLFQQFIHGGDKTVALKEATFSVDEGTCNIVFGPSGSGKSTLLNIISGIQPPTRGTVIVGGRDIYKLGTDELARFRAKNVGFIYQTNCWVKSLNVLQNVSVPLFFLGYTKKRAEKVAIMALDRVGMREYAKKNPIFLSDGEQQRVAAARALVSNPEIIIADEPTGNLDTNSGDRIMSLLLRNQIDLNGTLIIVTHNMEYLSLADHLLRIQDGELEDIKPENMKGLIDTLIMEVQFRVKQLLKMKENVEK